MEEFQTTVLIIAFVILIISMTFLGIIMYNSRTTDTFPPRSLPCPDYWTIGDNKCTSTSSGARNTLKDSAAIPARTNETRSALNALYATPSNTNNAGLNEPIKINPNANEWGTLYTGTNSFCAKKRWALTNNITWDGVTNSNAC